MRMRTGNVTIGGNPVSASRARHTAERAGRTGAEGFKEYLDSKPSACPTDATTVDIQQIGDRLTIGALLNRSARAVDTKDWGTRACSS